MMLPLLLGAQSSQRAGQSQRRAPQRYGQPLNPDKAHVLGRVIFSPVDKDGEETPGVGTVVMIVTEKKDTLYTTVGEKGSFGIYNVPVGPVFIRFSMMGFEEQARTITLNPGINKMVANLQPSLTELESAVVKETVSPVSVSADTIIFNAAAVKVNKGEKAIDILEQMPGVEVGDSGVKVLDEDVENVYIDGALLFGNAPMTALKNLDAEEVVNIKSYQEYSNKDPYHKIRNTESKVRVLDVNTKSKSKAVYTADVKLGTGFDTDSTYHKLRYSLGAQAARYSEGLQASVYFNANNINDADNRSRSNSFRTAGARGGADLRALNGSVSIRKKWMSPTTRNFALGSVGFSYNLADSYSVNESITQMLYFPNEKYESREVDKTSKSESTSKSHSFSINGHKSLRDGSVGLNLGGSFTTSCNDNWNTSYNIQDQLAPQGTSSRSTSDNLGRSYTASANFHKGLGNFRIKLDSSFGIGNSDNSTARLDTTTSTITYKEIDIDGDGNSRNMSISPGVTYHIDDNHSLSASYSFSDSYNRSERLALDVTNPDYIITDTVNTRFQTTASNTHSVSLTYRQHFEALKANLNVSMNYCSSGLDRDETFPVNDTYARRFNSFNPSVSLGTESMLDRWSVRYSASPTIPSLEQVRPKIDNTNLYSVSSGNPDLKQSLTHNLNLSFSTVLGSEYRDMVMEQEEMSGRAMEEMMDEEMMRSMVDRRFNSKRMSTLSVSASGRVTDNPIVARNIYYQNETYLPQYDYHMPAQSTFRTYENVGGSYAASMSVKFGTPLFDNVLMLNSSASFNWDDTPSYVDYTLTRTSNIRPSMQLGLRTIFSRNVRLNVSTTASYVHSANMLKDATDYFVERVNLGGDFNNIFDHMYAGFNYSKSFTQGLSYGKLDDNIFHMNVGVRLGPKNEYDLSLRVNDLFNSRTGFSTSMTSDYVTNKWTHNFGRYVMLNFEYRFNKMKKRAGR